MATTVTLEAARSNKDLLLEYLVAKTITYDLYEHPPVLTVEEQLKHVSHEEGGISKNLLLKDKKSRYILISALTTTKIDLKSLSTRLGLGKGGLRMAPDEALSTVLQVPPGCVTPFALFNSSSRNVTLLLDKGFKSHQKVLFHPLSNEATIGLSVVGFDEFLKSVGRDPSCYVDLEAEAVVGKDQPPDLAPYIIAESQETSVTNATKKEESTTQPVSTSGRKVGGKSDSGMTKEKSPKLQINGADISATSTKLITLISESLGLKEVASEEKNSKERQKLNTRVEDILVMFKNSAYSQGFNAGKSSIRSAFGN